MQSNHMLIDEPRLERVDDGRMAPLGATGWGRLGVTWGLRGHTCLDHLN